MDEELYLRIHVNDKGNIDAVYRLKEHDGVIEDGISSNRSLRSTPEITRLWEHKNSKLEGKTFGVLSIKINDVNNVEWKNKPALEVRFDPKEEGKIRNRAHTLIIGIPASSNKVERPKLKALREKLKVKTKWVINYNDPVKEVEFKDEIRD